MDVSRQDPSGHKHRLEQASNDSSIIDPRLEQDAYVISASYAQRFMYLQ